MSRPAEHGIEREELLATLTGFPHGGTSWERWSWLADRGREDLARVKLLESHVDALGVLDDLAPDEPAPAGLLAVWAAEPPGGEVRVEDRDGRTVLAGAKAFCSGADVVDVALVTATADGLPVLAAVDVRSARDTGAATPRADAWIAGGMHRAGTRTIDLDDVPGRVLGGPRAYLERPAFWHNAIGVAACWFGGTLAVAGLLHERARRHDDTLVHRQLGAVAVGVGATEASLRRAARLVDAGEADEPATARRLAETVRAQAAGTARATLDVVRTSLGPGPLAHRPDAVRACEDLAVYVLQHHGDRDLEALGRLVAAQEQSW